MSVFGITMSNSV